MIDLIKMGLQGIARHEAESIAQNNNLQIINRNGKITYDNMNNKYKDAFYIRVETNQTGRLKLECSLHKFYSHVRTKKQTNFDLFSFNNSKTAVKLLEQQTALDLSKMKVTYYEIGLNLNMANDCRIYLDQMETVGSGENKRTLFVNPRYKDKRVKTTVFHKAVKKVYKVYDKVFEMRDKRRTDLPDHPNILRIESIYKRVENLTLAELLNHASIDRLTAQFIKDWRTVQFSPEIIAENGTHQRKIELSKQILVHGTAETLNLYRMQHKEGSLTDKRFRNIREFIVNDWDTFKPTIIIIKSGIEKEYREKLTETLESLKD